MAATTTLEVVAEHILQHIPQDRKPLFVAIQGPQGSGKSYISAQIQKYLTSEPHHLRVALLSLDDLYFPHDKLVDLASSYPRNPLWQGRGQPGTHDVETGINLLDTLREGVQNIELPRFDKSLHNGQGDRLPLDGSGTIIIQPPSVDVVILEGWCVGFYPITQQELDNRWNGSWREERQKLGLLDGIKKLDIERVNETLNSYIQLWDFFDIFIQIEPSYFDTHGLTRSKYSIVYQWRLEQERNMKAQNGGRGMSEEAVKEFVDRYVPGYVFFGDIPPSYTPAGPPKWTGRSLVIQIDERREFLKAIKI